MGNVIDLGRVPRSKIDLEIDDAWHRMVQADSDNGRRTWCDRMTELIAARNAGRSPDEIAEIERSRGLR